MRKVKTLVAAGCLCAAMAMSSTAFAMPGATSLVTVESRAEEINEEEAKEEAKDKADQEEASVKTASDKEEESAKTADGAKKAEEEEPSPYDDIAVSTVNGDDDYVNVRDEASTDGEILGKIYNHCAADILETVEAEDGEWYKIRSGSVEGYTKAEYFVTGGEAKELALEIGKMYGYVLEGGLRVRTEPNTDSEVLTKLWSGEVYSVLEEDGDFVKISLGDDDEGEPVTGYIAAEYVDVYVKFDEAISIEEEQEQKEEEERRAREAEEAARKAEEEAEAASSASTRDAVVAYAKQFIGNPYVWGGTSLTNGADCSGFTKSVMAHFGVGLSRTSGAQANDGYRISVGSVEPGDLVFYASGGSIYHVAMYIGGGKVIHAIDESRGIGVSSMYFATPYCAVDVLG